MTAVVVTFVILFATTLAVFHLLRAWRRERRSLSGARLRAKLRDYVSVMAEEKRVSIEARTRALSGVPLLHALLSRLSCVPRLERLLQQAGVEQSPGVVVLWIAVLALAGSLLGRTLQLGLVVSLGSGFLAGYLPVVYLHRKKKTRVAAFQRQLPEALDLIGRALRAGHAFTSGMKLAAENFKAPLGQEFNRTVGEINFGAPVPDALKSLAHRVDCPDLRFFVVAVILQRETGGNLAEIIESMSRIIRERFAFEEKVHALTAEGRLSAKIIAGLVCTIVGLIYLQNPGHFTPLLEHPTGRFVAFGAAASVVLGLVVIHRMAQSVRL